MLQTMPIIHRNRLSLHCVSLKELTFFGFLTQFLFFCLCKQLFFSFIVSFLLISSQEKISRIFAYSFIYFVGDTGFVEPVGNSNGLDLENLQNAQHKYFVKGQEDGGSYTPLLRFYDCLKNEKRKTMNNPLIWTKTFTMNINERQQWLPRKIALTKL